MWDEDIHYLERTIEKLNSPEFLYIFQMIIQQNEPGPIKIGRAINPLQRFKNIRGFLPFPLQVIIIIPGNSFFETYLQNTFRHLRINGEWFRPSNAIVSHVLQEPCPFIVEPKDFHILRWPEKRREHGSVESSG